MLYQKPVFTALFFIFLKWNSLKMFESAWNYHLYDIYFNK